MTSIKITSTVDNIFMKSKTTFQILTTTLLSLLLPLSFLLLARLSIADYLLSLTLHEFQPELEPVSESEPPPSLVFFSFLLNSIPLSPLHILVSLVCIASLVHTFNDGRIHSCFSMSAVRPSLHTAWIILCTLQVCVGFGIEGSIGAGIDASGIGEDKKMLWRNIVFFLGLYATTVYWSRMIVKRVVDDTMFGCEMEERWVERVVMGVSLGGLWWWRLRGEVESLVVVMEMKREMEVGVGVVDFMGWWLYYLVVMIGMVRVVKGLIWFGVILLCHKVDVKDDDDHDSFVNLRLEEKV